MKELIEDRGAELIYLPSYSPDLNPIEQAFSKTKNILRKLGARTHQALLEAMEGRSARSRPRMRTDGSITAVKRSRFGTYEHRCQPAPNCTAKLLFLRSVELVWPITEPSVVSIWSCSAPW
jgi:DDE superfamily endonuclease